MLTNIFGIVIVAGAIRLLIARPTKAEEDPPENLPSYLVVDLPPDFAVGLIGIDRGALMIPTMVVLLPFEAHQTVGISSGSMILTASHTPDIGIMEARINLQEKGKSPPLEFHALIQLRGHFPLGKRILGGCHIPEQGELIW
jgi:hypothetical protein